MAKSSRLALIGFDSISLSFLDRFIERGVMPNVKALIERGSTTQTWPCYPWETGTNWACLATGASPWVHGVNMHMHVAGRPLDEWVSGFDPALLKAEPLWTAAHRAGKRSIVIDWSQSWPLPFEDGIIHIGENGNPSWGARALQAACGYRTDLKPTDWWGQQLVRPIAVEPVRDWPGAPDGALYAELPIIPTHMSRYRKAESLHALVLRGAGGYDRVAIYGRRGGATPLLVCHLNRMTEMVMHEYEVDGGKLRAPLRAKLLKLSADGRDLALHVSQIYSQEDFAHPTELCAPLVKKCGPFVRLPCTQQFVQCGGTDVATFVEEQEYFSKWYADAAEHLLSTQPWDLFMVKWHTPDWFQHLTFYMIDPRHPLYDPAREQEGWALWDKVMGWGDRMVERIVRAAGPDALIGLVSDHGGECELPGINTGRNPLAVLEKRGWLVKGADGKPDWSRTVAYGHGSYILLNVKGRDPHGIVEPGLPQEKLRNEIIDALLDHKDESGRHVWRAALPYEDANRLGVGGDRVGDVFLIAARPASDARVDMDKYWKTHTREQVGTWDWPRVNGGVHLDDSYFVLAGPGVRQGYRRARPTLITSVAPTAAIAAGLPVPKDADGAALWDFLKPNP